MPIGQKKLTSGENNPRFRRFRELYVVTGNAVQSAITAGYSKSYAESFAHKMAWQVQTSAAGALRSRGADEIRLAACVDRMLNAKVSKRNPATKSWDKFDDNATQAAGARLLAEILNALPRGNAQGGDVDRGGWGGQGFRLVIKCPRPDRTKQLAEMALAAKNPPPTIIG